MVIEPADHPEEQEKKLKSLELELNDLRQGLTVVADYYKDLERVSRQQDAVEAVDETVARQLVEDEREFEGIWRFHEEMLIGDTEARVPFQSMYDAFVRFCTRNGRMAVDRDAFEFVFSHMENPVPVADRGEWIGYRLRGDKV
jgi:hypothetical protein